MYLDPPYSWDTRTSARYAVDMNNDQQKKLIDIILGLKHAKILISGYNCPEYERMEKIGMEKIEMEIKTQDGNRKPKSKIEVLWRNYGKDGGGLFG
jgi:site-specific DNA-adenine methylase